MQCNIRGEGSHGDLNYYNIANYDCRINITNFKSKHEFHPSGKILYVCLNVVYSEFLVGEFIVESPYESRPRENMVGVDMVLAQ